MNKEKLNKEKYLKMKKKRKKKAKVKKDKGTVVKILLPYMKKLNRQALNWVCLPSGIGGKKMKTFRIIKQGKNIYIEKQNLFGWWPVMIYDPMVDSDFLLTFKSVKSAENYIRDQIEKPKEIIKEITI